MRAASAVVADSASLIEGTAVSGVFQSSFQTWINSGTNLNASNSVHTQKFPSGLIMKFGRFKAYESLITSPHVVNFGTDISTIYNIHVQGTDGHYNNARNYQALTVTSPNNSSIKIFWQNNLIDYIFWIVIGKA